MSNRQLQLQHYLINYHDDVWAQRFDTVTFEQWGAYAGLVARDDNQLWLIHSEDTVKHYNIAAFEALISKLDALVAEASHDSIAWQRGGIILLTRRWDGIGYQQGMIQYYSERLDNPCAMELYTYTAIGSSPRQVNSFVVTRKAYQVAII